MPSEDRCKGTTPRGPCKKRATIEGYCYDHNPYAWTKGDSDALDLVILVMRGYSVPQAAEQLGMKPGSAWQLLRYRNVDLASLRAPVPWMPEIRTTDLTAMIRSE